MTGGGAAPAAGELAGAIAGEFGDEFAGIAAAAGAGLNAFTALWQPDESADMCCFRQLSAGAPPVGTDEQCAM
jgi:hypothetical protein